MVTHKELTHAIQAGLDKLADEYAKERAKIEINKVIDQQRQGDDGAWLEEYERKEREEIDNAHLTLIAEEEQILFGDASCEQRQRGTSISSRP